MNVFELLLDRRRVVLTMASIAVFLGVVSWLTMPTQEDPKLPDRNGILVVPFPGADAETIERLVVEPLEEQLAQVSELFYVESTSRTDAAVLRLELRDEVTDVDAAWDDVEEAIDDARAEFPDGVGDEELDTGLISEQEAIVLAVTGSLDPLELLRVAREVRTDLLRLDGVAEVRLLADPGEQVTIEYDDALARRLALPPEQLVAQLRGRNATVPAGSVRLGGRAATLAPRSELDSLQDLERSALTLSSGAAIPLGDLARVRLGPAEPASELLRVDGERAVGLGVVPDARLDVIGLGHRVRAELDRLRAEHAPLVLRELSFQPDHVTQRLDGLTRSLMLGIGIVALVLVSTMGFRLGLLVTAVVPLVGLSSVALYALGGGVLQQLSVAALIVALGLLVDNAIVVAEATQQHLDAGLSRREAAAKAARELVTPLATATGTTLAAFVPMLLSRGATGDFTRAIPIVVMLTLTVSYVFAILVTPVLSEMVLRRRTKEGEVRESRLLRGIGRFGAGRPKTVVVLAMLLIGVAIAMAAHVEASFFPPADRNQLVVEVFLPEGAHLDETDAAARRLERHLQSDARVAMVASFVGRAAPSFYYNLPNRPRSPHFAHLLVVTKGLDVIPAVMDDARRFAHAELPEAEVIPRALEQGPPLDAPLEIRLFGEDLEALRAGALVVMGELRELDGTLNVRHDQGNGRATVVFDIDDAAAARHDLDRAAVARALLKQTRGLLVGQLRSEDDPIPILVRSAAGESLDPDRLPVVEAATRSARFVPVREVSTPSLEWRPAAIHRRDQERMVTVSAQLAEGVAYSKVVSALEPRLERADWPKGVRWEHGGAVEGAGKANTAILASGPLAAGLLLFFLLLDFNSFRRVMIIFATVPLAAVGVIPGLVLADQPFGFMSLLGVFALLGIVVNNAIVLLSVVDARLKEGASVHDALTAAVQVRTRPILLTTATTVAGLLPLALSSSSLWPPMAFAMIAGLLASTLLTLFVVPALFALAFPERTTAPLPSGAA